MRGPMLEQGEKCKEGGVAGTKCYKLTAIPLGHPPHASQREEIEESGTKEFSVKYQQCEIEPGKKEAGKAFLVLSLFLAISLYFCWEKFNCSFSNLSLLC